MWAMTDEQLRFYADDDLVSFERRQMARLILNERGGEAVRDAFPTTQGDALNARLEEGEVTT